MPQNATNNCSLLEHEDSGIKGLGALKHHYLTTNLISNSKWTILNIRLEISEGKYNFKVHKGGSCRCSSLQPCTWRTMATMGLFGSGLTPRTYRISYRGWKAADHLACCCRSVPAPELTERKCLCSSHLPVISLFCPHLSQPPSVWLPVCLIPLVVSKAPFPTQSFLDLFPIHVFSTFPSMVWFFSHFYKVIYYKGKY